MIAASSGHAPRGAPGPTPYLQVLSAHRSPAVRLLVVPGGPRAFLLPTGEPPVRLRLTPREDSYYDLFTVLAEHLVTGANLLAEMLGAPRSARKEIGRRLADAEHQADESTHQIMQRLNQTFVTPFDRDDIYLLAARLDDCMDFMEEAADRIVLYKVDSLPPRVADVVQVLQRAAELTAEAMPKLRSMHDLQDYWVEVNRLENQADKAYRKLIAQMFDEVDDPILLMKLKEIVEKLEEAADAFERVANTVETVALKES